MRCDSSGSFARTCDKIFRAQPPTLHSHRPIIVCDALNWRGKLGRARPSVAQGRPNAPRCAQAGQPAPLFSLPDADMETVDLGQFRGKKTSCSISIPRTALPIARWRRTDFSDHETSFPATTACAGVSPDDAFATRFPGTSTAFPSGCSRTPRARWCRKYGVVHEKEANGSRYPVSRAPLSSSTARAPEARVLRCQCHSAGTLPTCWTYSDPCVDRSRASSLSERDHRKRHDRLARRRACRHLGKLIQRSRSLFSIARWLREHISAAEAALEGRRSRIASKCVSSPRMLSATTTKNLSESSRAAAFR